jgi:prophage DNA circulation protein
MSWINRLLPASFRGIRFNVDEHRERGGRRIDLRQYPYRDTPSTEDLGKEAGLYRIRAYVIASLATQDYIDARDALRKACWAKGPGTLVHPYLGSVSVNLRSFDMQESVAFGGMAVFDFEFVDSGLTPGPVLSASTASGLLGGLSSLLSLAVEAYAIGSLIAQRPGVLLSIAEGALGLLVANLTGLPASIISQVAGVVNGIVNSLTAGSTPVTSTVTGLTGDPVAIAVSDAFSSIAQAVIAGLPAAVTSDPVLGLPSTLIALPADPTQGVAAFATWLPGLAAPSGLQVPLQTQLQQQLTDLVNGCAVIAVAQIYASTDFSSTAAAAAAKTQLLGMLDARVVAAAAADEDALFQGWLGVTGLAIADLVQRAQNLPNLAAYTTQVSLPSAALAQLLLHDGSQADALATLNAAVHPSFMPVTGVYLQASS